MHITLCFCKSGGSLVRPIEDPEDGYRSHCKDLEVCDEELYEFAKNHCRCEDH